MLHQNTLDKIQELKLFGILEAWNNILLNNEHTNLTITETIGLLIEHEYLYRKNKKQARLIKNANLRYNNSCLENMNRNNNIPREQLNQLRDTLWLHNKQNIIICGPTGVGKSYLACALANSVCRHGYSAKYYKLSKLLELFKITNADGSYIDFCLKTAKLNCLVIDDWGIEPMPVNRCNNLLDLVDDFYQKGSIVITSQLPIEHWHDHIKEPMIADAILDRLINNTIIVNLDGESLRKNLTHVDRCG